MKEINDELVIDFNGRIIDAGLHDDDWCISARALSEMMQGTSLDTIRLIIDSYGGDVQEGLAMYDVIKEMSASKKIIGEVRGRCASAATLPLYACSERVITPNSTLMMHQPTGGFWGTPEAAEKWLEVFRAQRDRVYLIYEEVSGKTRAEIETLMTDELWLIGEKAVEDGWCTSVKTAGAPAQVDEVNMIMNKIAMYGRGHYKPSLMARSLAMCGLPSTQEKERVAAIMQEEQKLRAIMEDNQTKMDEIAKREAEIAEELAELEEEKKALEAEKAALEDKQENVDEAAQQKATEMLANVPVPTANLPKPANEMSVPPVEVEQMKREEWEKLSMSQRMEKQDRARAGLFKLID